MQLENSNSLEPEVATLCRCLDMRSAYLAPDRMDISESINCFRWHIQTPREGHMMWCLPSKMKKEGGSSRTLDSAWAGDLGADAAIRRGKHMLRHVSTMQTCIGLSSAESVLTRGGCLAMGTQSHLADQHVPTANILFSDASTERCNAKERSRKAEM